MFYKWDDLIPKEYCEFLISQYENKGEYEVATTSSSYSSECTTPEIRKTQMKWLDANDIINRMMRDYMMEANSKFFNYDITGQELPQFGKYENGDHYTWHQDPIKEQTDICRKLTTAILLSDPTTYEGGVFEFYGGDSTTIPIVNQGAVMVFDSLDWHRVTPVTSGRRFSLIQWATGPKFR